MQRSAEKIVTSAKKKAPVDVGVLQGSISHKGLNGSYKQGAIVFTPTEYAIYQEFGYKRKVSKGDKIMVFGKWRTATKDYQVIYSGQPFMRPAFDENRTQIEADVVKFISDRLRIIAK